jgi:hypothetical protein
MGAGGAGAVGGYGLLVNFGNQSQDFRTKPLDEFVRFVVTPCSETDSWLNLGGFVRWSSGSRPAAQHGRRLTTRSRERRCGHLRRARCRVKPDQHSGDQRPDRRATGWVGRSSQRPPRPGLDDARRPQRLGHPLHDRLLVGRIRIVCHRSLEQPSSVGRLPGELGPGTRPGSPLADSARCGLDASDRGQSPDIPPVMAIPINHSRAGIRPDRVGRFPGLSGGDGRSTPPASRPGSISSREAGGQLRGPRGFSASWDRRLNGEMPARSRIPPPAQDRFRQHRSLCRECGLGYL